jgi:predicted DNA-binding protein (MmcQ/YjbR family)
MDHKTVEDYILSMPNARLEYPFGEDVAVYKVGRIGKSQHGDGTSKNGHGNDAGKMFALIREGKEPVQLSLKCDPQLTDVLRAKYDEIMPGYHLNKKHWNTLVLAGQLEWEEVQGLIRHSYELVAGAAR